MKTPQKLSKVRTYRNQFRKGSQMDNITIYHNPKCSKSLETLDIIRSKGIQPEIVHYLDTPPTQTEIKRIMSLLGCMANDIVRINENRDDELDLATAREDELIQAMSEHPSLIQRPIVVAQKKAVVARPPSNVLPLL